MQVSWEEFGRSEIKKNGLLLRNSYLVVQMLESGYLMMPYFPHLFYNFGRYRFPFPHSLFLKQAFTLHPFQSAKIRNSLRNLQYMNGLGRAKVWLLNLVFPLFQMNFLKDYTTVISWEFKYSIAIYWEDFKDYTTHNWNLTWSYS